MWCALGCIGRGQVTGLTAKFDWVDCPLPPVQIDCRKMHGGGQRLLRLDSQIYAGGDSYLAPGTPPETPLKAFTLDASPNPYTPGGIEAAMPGVAQTPMRHVFQPGAIDFAGAGMETPGSAVTPSTAGASTVAAAMSTDGRYPVETGSGGSRPWRFSEVGESPTSRMSMGFGGLSLKAGRGRYRGEDDDENISPSATGGVNCARRDSLPISGAAHTPSSVGHLPWIAPIQESECGDGDDEGPSTPMGEYADCLDVGGQMRGGAKGEDEVGEFRLNPVPDTPFRPGRLLPRQSSLNETKLLMRTALKRSDSIFGFNSMFEWCERLGRGAFSEVYRCRHLENGQWFAIKKSGKKFRNRREREQLLHEIMSVAQFTERHPNIVTYYQSWQEENFFYIQMELCEGGNLSGAMDRQVSPLPNWMIWRWVRHVALGLEYTHGQGIKHLDIKPENIFLTAPNLHNAVLKIGDFGMAVLGNQWDGEEGDCVYMAPELLNSTGDGIGASADIFSFGIMLYEWMVLVGDGGKSKLPRGGPNWHALREGRRDIVPKITLGSRPEAMTNLMLAMINPDPAKRPTASQIAEVVNQSIPEEVSVQNESLAQDSSKTPSISPKGTV